MKARDESYKGMMYTTDLSNGVTTVESDRPGSRYMLSVGTLVKGNHVSPNPWSYTVTEVRFLRGTNDWLYQYSGKPVYGLKQKGCIAFDTFHPMFDDMAFPTDLYNATLSDLNDQTRGSLDLSIDLAQAGMNIRMMNVIGRIRNYTLKGFSKSLLRNSAKTLAAARLEYVYGWKPLADDLYGVLDESIRIVINEIENFSAGKSRAIGNVTGTVKVGYYGSAPCVVDRTGRHICKIGLRLKTKSFDPARWASLNPISWAYELTPYSFVLDWLIDVGGYLRNLETSLLYANSFVSGYVTQVSAVDCTASVNGSRREAGTPTYMYTVSGSMQGRKIIFSRSVLRSYPLPRLPTFRVDLGSNRLLNLAALLAQKL